jgi:phosphatidylserine decarboxylase
MDLTGCEKQSFSSFNDFFTRRLRPDQRPIDLDPAAFISPCDGQLSVFHLNSSRMFQIKGSRYSLPDLLGGQENATRYANGLCLVFRLCVDDYHRYCYIDWGVKGENHFLPGILHTVRPIALASCPVFIQNSREYTVLETEHFGAVTQVEVGALLVGRIQNHHGPGPFQKGQEKGLFLFGGSTILLLLEPHRVALLPELLTQCQGGREIPVRQGQTLGYAASAQNALRPSSAVAAAKA